MVWTVSRISMHTAEELIIILEIQANVKIGELDVRRLLCCGYETAAVWCDQVITLYVLLNTILFFLIISVSFWSYRKQKQI